MTCTLIPALDLMRWFVTQSNAGNIICLEFSQWMARLTRVKSACVLDELMRYFLVTPLKYSPNVYTPN